MIILSNVHRLYDGSSAGPEALHEGVDLHLEDGRIVAIREHGGALAAAGAGERRTIIDASRFTVTPGLVDTHGHVTLHGIRDADLDRANSAEGLLWVERVLHTTLVDGGVTTMRDVGGATHRIKRLVDDGVVIGPRLKIAICMLSTTGGHADARSPDRCHAELSRLFPEAPGRPSSMVGGPWECRKRVREIAACGADLIKLCTSPGVASPGDRLEHRDFTGEEIAAICDEAAARGLSVAAHAHSASGIRLALDNGVHDIQHISFMTEELVDLASARGAVVTPTSWVMSELLAAEGLSGFVMDKAKQVAEVHRRAVEYAARGGLPILAGTDPVLPGMHGRNYLEVASLIADGLRPLAAWYGATGLAAGEIGQDDAGVIAPGKRADLLVGEGEVIDHPEGLGKGGLVEVIKDGIAYRGGLPAIPQRTYRNRVRATLWPDR